MWILIVFIFILLYIFIIILDLYILIFELDKNWVLKLNRFINNRVFFVDYVCINLMNAKVVSM